jgi:uncharacterized protein YebE (UPF0316 family)
MLNLLSLFGPWMALAIFGLRVIDMSLDTLRVLFIIRERRAAAWFAGFVQSALWVVAITSVLANLDNPLNLIAYAAGFATGSVLGLAIEERLAVGFGHLRVMSSRRGIAIAEAIRQAGYAVTEFAGRGKDGAVAVITCSLRRRDLSRVQRTIAEIDPEAFVAVQDVTPLHRGFWRA